MNSKRVEKKQKSVSLPKNIIKRGINQAFKEDRDFSDLVAELIDERCGNRPSAQELMKRMESIEQKLDTLLGTQ